MFRSLFGNVGLRVRRLSACRCLAGLSEPKSFAALPVAGTVAPERGDVGGVGKFFYQIGAHRPTPELAQYAVPGASGIYLAGTFMHPRAACLVVDAQPEFGFVAISASTLMLFATGRADAGFAPHCPVEIAYFKRKTNTLGNAIAFQHPQ